MYELWNGNYNYILIHTQVNDLDHEGLNKLILLKQHVK